MTKSLNSRWESKSQTDSQNYVVEKQILVWRKRYRDQATWVHVKSRQLCQDVPPSQTPCMTSIQEDNISFFIPVRNVARNSSMKFRGLWFPDLCMNITWEIQYGAQNTLKFLEKQWHSTAVGGNTNIQQWGTHIAFLLSTSLDVLVIRQKENGCS